MLLLLVLKQLPHACDIEIRGGGGLGARGNTALQMPQKVCKRGKFLLKPYRY